MQVLNRLVWVAELRPQLSHVALHTKLLAFYGANSSE